jgi:hypothetical protein
VIGSDKYGMMYDGGQVRSPNCLQTADTEIRLQERQNRLEFASLLGNVLQDNVIAM